jgi:tetratricopeptide (TPR) repeat protein
MTQLCLEEYRLPGAPLGEENPLPVFRASKPDRTMELRGNFPAEKHQLTGWQAGFRVLPYRMQDQYGRSRSEMSFQAVVLENDILRATFLPELGGRLVSLVDLKGGGELLSRNPVFQPANLAIRNAWFNGGIEWNIGQYGHTFFTCAPVFAAEIRGLSGEPGLRLFEYERCKGLFWQIDFFLPQGSPVLISYARVVNASRNETSFYWWTNIGVPEKPGLRILAPSRKVIYVIGANGEDMAYGWGELPHLPILAADASYPTNFSYGGEHFYQLDEAAVPWEAALDEDGQGIFEASTGRLRYRKIFCWGSRAGGEHWKQILSEPGNDELEIQAGMTPTQEHGLRMPGGASWDWLQVFGRFCGDAAQIHQADYESAIRYVDSALCQKHSPENLEKLRESYAALAQMPAVKILQQASGWGALELARRKTDPQELALPAGIDFPAGSISVEQQKWLDLLNQEVFPDPDPVKTPGEWMIQPEWLQLLEKLPTKNWFSLLHEGVMRIEQFDLEGAGLAWQDSIRLQPSCWVLRNLAALARMQGQMQQALEYYEQAFSLAQAGENLPIALAVEYLQTFCAAERFQEALEVIRSLPEEYQQADRVQILSGRIFLELGNLVAVEKVLRREYAVIREGENELTDLWADLWLRREADSTGQLMDRSHRQEILQKYPPPTSIDYRIFNSK